MGFRKNTALATSGKGAEDRQFVRALARGLEVLKVFSAEDRGLSNAEIARRTGFPKPTVSRLTFTLLSLGYLHLDEDTGRYSLHPHVLSLGFPVLRQLSVRDIARPMMQELADHCGGAVALGIRDGLNMIVIERARHPSMSAVPLDIGVGRDIAKTAMGRALLASMDPDDRRDMLAALRDAHGPEWPSLAPGIDDALESYRTNGFTVSAGDWIPEYNAVGVPLKLADGTTLAFNCGGTSNRITADLLPGLGRQLRQLVETLAHTQDLST
ncbi:MAG: IclR family transcriptional regulator [Magnetovibrio sp.]|nr:IclR family transcriptional regulator [Magnetovibrio sp.]